MRFSKTDVLHGLTSFLAPIVCSFTAVLYVQLVLLTPDTMPEVNTLVHDNKIVSQANAISIDELHKKVLEQTINQFRTAEMQAWIREFRLENPDLIIPNIAPLAE